MQAAEDRGYESGSVLYMAMELSNRQWKLGFSNGSRMRRKSIEARDQGRLLAEVSLAKQKLGLAAGARVICCYEAGRDGHWIHRWLSSEGFEVLEIDSSSIETNRRKHVKTDRIDVEKLLDLLLRYCLGFRKAFRVVRVPPEAAEAGLRLHREDEYLTRQRTRVSNRIKSLLVTQGIDEVSLQGDFPARLERLRRWDGQGLSPELKAELARMHAQYRLIEEQLSELVQAYAAELETAASAVGATRRQLETLKAMGPKTSRIVSAEVLAWRKFAKAKEVGGMSGLTPTPSQSGDEHREQGISKAGNRRVRRVMIEFAWLWLRWQPDSELSRWFRRRFAHGSRRMRRIGIVALARKLLIALWRYVEFGEIPAGAVLKAS